MVVADHPRQLPAAVRLLPQHGELGHAAGLGIAGRWCRRRTKHVISDFHRAKSFQRIDFQRSGHQLTMSLAADIGFDAATKTVYVPTFWKNSVVAYKVN